MNLYSGILPLKLLSENLWLGESNPLCPGVILSAGTTNKTVWAATYITHWFSRVSA